MAFLSMTARKGLTLAVIGAALAVSMADPAEARWRGRHGGYRGGVVAAAVGGLAAGALIAGAASRPAYAAPAYGYSYGYAPAYSAPTTYYSAEPSYYAPAYATPTYYAPARPRRAYRSYAAYGEPVCRISRQRVWLDSHTYTFRKVTRCR